MSHVCVCAVCVPCTTCSISQFLSATNSFNWLLISIEHSWLFLCFCMTGSCFSATTTHTPHTYTDIETISFKLNFYFFYYFHEDNKCAIICVPHIYVGLSAKNCESNKYMAKCQYQLIYACVASLAAGSSFVTSDDNTRNYA